jgi:hypothetical protein
MSKSVELHEYIKFIKEEVRKSEDIKPKEGFWIGAQSLEITFQTVTEVDKKCGLRIFLLSAEGARKKRLIQTVKISLVTQEFKSKPQTRVWKTKDGGLAAA